MTSLILHDSIHSLPSAMGPRFRPFACSNHQVTKGRYITSNDPRGYIPVYEYPLNGQWIMMDIDDGYILWTGIWKALGNSKADIVKMIDSQPDLASLIRRVRGGYLKIQGTWMPYEVALRLSRRVAWTIREDLIPLFGPTFPSTCLSPDQPGYGQVVASGATRRRMRRNHSTATIPSSPSRKPTSWTVVTPISSLNNTTTLITPPTPTATSLLIPKVPRQTQHAVPLFSTSAPDPPLYRMSLSDIPNHSHRSNSRRAYSNTISIPITSPRLTSQVSSPAPTGAESQFGRDRSGSVYASARYSPYPGLSASGYHTTTQHRTSISTSSSSTSRRMSSTSGTLDIPPSRGGTKPNADNAIILPPIRPPAQEQNLARTATTYSYYALPPISALEDLRGVNCSDSEAVLRRLKEDDDYDISSSFSGSGFRDDGQRQEAVGGGGGGMRRRSLPALTYHTALHEKQASDRPFSSRSMVPPLPRSFNESTRDSERCRYLTHSDCECDVNSEEGGHRRPCSSHTSRDEDGDSAYERENTTPMSPDTPRSGSAAPSVDVSRCSSGKSANERMDGARGCEWGTGYGRSGVTALPESEVRVASPRNGRLSACRHSFGGDSGESGGENEMEFGRPLRPW